MKVHPTVKVLMILILLTITTWAGIRGFAAWNYRTAWNITVDMVDSDLVTQKGLDEAEQHVGLALRCLPQHPDYLDLFGRISELRANQPGMVGKVRRDELEEAAEYYREALSVRPLWPYSWANLLRVKDHSGQPDDEFLLALRRSIETGPWERGVQLQVLNSSLRHWDKLGLREKTMVEQAVKNAMKVQPGKAFSIVRSFSRPELLCGAETKHRQVERWCVDLGWTLISTLR